jgi:hypothetical protein
VSLLTLSLLGKAARVHVYCMLLLADLQMLCHACTGCECASDMETVTVRQLLLAIQRGQSGVFRLNARAAK